MQQIFSRPARLLSAAAFVGLLSGCAHVGQDDFQAEMERIRGEIRAGDQANAERIDGVESDVAALDARLGNVESELQALAQEFDATVSRLEASLRFAAPVHFEFDAADVRGQDRPLLQRFAAVIQDHYPGALITVEGFTDPAGPAEYNMQLGQRRAEAVRTVLLQDGGLMESRVRAVSYGEDTRRLVNPNAAGADDTAAMANRRVVLVVEQAGSGM